MAVGYHIVIPRNVRLGAHSLYGLRIRYWYHMTVGYHKYREMSGHLSNMLVSRFVNIGRFMVQIESLHFISLSESR